MAGRIQISGDLVEVVVLADAQRVFATQELVEVVVAAPTASPTVVTGAGISQELVEVVVQPGSPSAAVAQELVEVVVSGDTIPLEVSQELVEVVVLASGSRVFSTQELVEVVVAAPTASPTVVTGAGISQELVEVVVQPGSPNVGVTQELVEVVVSGTAPVYVDLSFNYILRALRDGDLAFSYTINAVGQTQIGSNLALDYGINTTKVGANLAFSYKVAKATKLQQRGADLRVRYEIIVFAQVGANLGIVYGIAPATTVVGAELTFDAPVQNVVHPGVDLTFTYDIQVPEPIASDLVLDYSVASTAHSDLTFDAAIQTGVVTPPPAALPPLGRAFVPRLPRKRRPEPPVRLPQPVHADLSINAARRTLVSSDLGFAFSRHRTVAAMLTVSASIANLVGSELTLDHQVIDWYDYNMDVLLEEMDPDLIAVLRSYGQLP